MYRFGYRDNFAIKDNLHEPKANARQIKIKVAYASVNPIDARMRNGSLRLPLFLFLPMILGFDVCGEVVETGAKVKKFKPGDLVLGQLGSPFGGAYAEYAVSSEKYFVHKPEDLDCEEAAAIPMTFLTAYQALLKTERLKKDRHILIQGASGGVGVAAVQLAKLQGATVTAVCREKNHELVRSLGADYTIDYKKVSFSDYLSHSFSDSSDDKAAYDIIFNLAPGSGFYKMKSLLKKRGIYITVNPRFTDILAILSTPLTLLSGITKRCTMLFVQSNGNDLQRIVNWFAEGRLKTVINKIFPLVEIQKAHKMIDEGHTQGKILLSLSRNDEQEGSQKF